MIFGYPLTNPQVLTGQTGTTTRQTFERARLEQRDAGPITLALLGVMVHPPDPVATPLKGAHYFPETRHNLNSGSASNGGSTLGWRSAAH